MESTSFLKDVNRIDIFHCLHYIIVMIMIVLVFWFLISFGAVLFLHIFKKEDPYIIIHNKLKKNRQVLNTINFEPTPDNMRGALSLTENKSEEGKLSLFNPGDDNEKQPGNFRTAHPCR